MAKHFRDDGGTKGTTAPASARPQVHVEKDRPYGTAGPGRGHGLRRGSGRRRSRRGGRRRRVWPWVACLVILALVAACGYVGLRLRGSARAVKADAGVAMQCAQGYVDAAKAGDAALLSQSAQDLSDAAHRVHDELEAPEWKLAAILPVVGSDVRSVRVLGDVLVDLSDNALVPMASNSGLLELSHLMGDGSVNMAALEGISGAITQAEPVVRRSAEAIEALPPARLPQVSSALESVREVIVGASDGLSRLSPILPYLPELLGSGGTTRTYLVVASNVAEVHAVGGFTGIVGRLEATDGHISMGDFDTVRTYMPFDDTSGGANAEEIDVIGRRCDIYSGDHNCVLNYARAGQIYHDHWLRCQEQDVDGVLSFDPVFLQYMLELVGGVQTSQGVTVDGTNAASVIMNKCLFWWDGDACDAFYEEVAELALKKVLAGLGDVDTTKFVETVGKASAEGRCLAWLSNQDAEAAVKAGGFGWELPHDVAAPLTGVFVNDWSVSKASYYLDVVPEVGQPTQNADGTSSWPVTLRLTNNASRSLLAGYIPNYLTIGDRSQPKRSELDLYEQLYLTAPEGGRIEGLSYEYQNSAVQAPELVWEEKTYEGLDTWRCSILHLDAEETCQVTYTVVTAPGAKEPLAVRTTPVMPAELRAQ